MPYIVKFIAKLFKKKLDIGPYYYYNDFLLCTSLQPRQEEYDDNCSMITIDTMETIDDNPGTGRTVDKYFFQPIGRKNERFAMRITITSLPPWRISQYFDTNLDLYVNVVYSFHSNIGQALAGLGELKRGSTIIAGLKSIVKQTQ